MSPEEIAERAQRIGVYVCMKRRVLTDVYGSDLPYAEDVEFAYGIPRGPQFEVVDGMCRCRDAWLPWENHGKTWCFADEEMSSVTNRKLKEMLYDKNRKNG